MPAIFILQKKRNNLLRHRRGQCRKGKKHHLLRKFMFLPTTLECHAIIAVYKTKDSFVKDKFETELAS